ncbi:protein MID1-COMPLEMENTING ACTIVITY 1-like isoform X2 [Magnolia sinica]|uniref:protein MID1-COMPLEMENTING ACTIVITY 1-like isoform X2 n=1 Tax=Magnolia sinica TaxID=86752 RepID=UPI00265ACAFD|nr:protein MID1-COMPLEMENTING ACTIVITY 1-like isoform X2 [Magnolia sinica]
MASMVVQAAGVDAVRIISLIVKSARNAKMHRTNCAQIAGHVKMIGNLLETLKSTDVSRFPATREPLDGLEEALRRALDLVESCRHRSYLYLLAMGWNVVYQFRQVQNEIDRYMKILPLISLVHGYRIQDSPSHLQSPLVTEVSFSNFQEGLQAIEEDHRDYTLDEEDVEAQNVLLKSNHTKEDADILEKSLSRRYPNLAFDAALQEENEKLQLELQRSQVNNDTEKCDVIQHLIEVTKTVVNKLPEKNQTHHPQFCTGSGEGSAAQVSHEAHHEVLARQGKYRWQTDLFDCCEEPCLCLRTCIYPCGTFASIANVASRGSISHEHACNDLMAYSLVFGCCCYTCCMRRRLRGLFSIKGGSCDDFLSHLMCCCCALVQEWREIKLRGYEGPSAGIRLSRLLTGVLYSLMVGHIG